MKKRSINPIFFLYQWLIFFPVFLVTTILTALTTIVMCALFNDRVWGFYPAMIWSRITCYMAFVRVKVSGREHIRPNQSYIFVCNHQSLFDIFAVYGWLNIPFKWIMKKELEKIPFVGPACKSAGHIFITRGQSKSALQSIEDAKKKLQNGLSVVIFPEGSRTFDGNVNTFKRGAFQIASDLSLPIIPVSISGAFVVMPRTSFLLKPHKIELVFHEEVSLPHNGQHNTEDIEKIRSIIANDVKH